jgi:hypothetical protein
LTKEKVLLNPPVTALGCEFILKPQRIPEHCGTGHKTKATTELIFEGQILQISKRYIGLTYELPAKNIQLLKEPDEVCSRGSETHFRLFLAAIEEVIMEIGTRMHSILNL